MINKKLFAILFLCFMLVGTMAQVSAYMPRYTHKLIHQTALQEPVNSELYNACMKYPSLCYTGNVLTDISVIWYWTEGYKYAVTHSPNFCRALIEESKNDKDYACAIGGCMHQPSDIVSHNKMVPWAIEHSFLANTVIHVFAEQKVDNWVEDNYPSIGTEALNYLSDYEQCMPLFKRVMLGYEEYGDITEEEVNAKFDKFVVEIMTSQTGYDTAFEQKSFAVNFKALPFTIIAGYILILAFFLLVSILLLIKMLKRNAKKRHYIALFLIFLPIALLLSYVFIANLQGSAFSAVIKIAKPVSFLVPLGDTPESYVNQAVVNTKAFLQEGPQWLANTDASGFPRLTEADNKILFMDYLILLGILGFFVWYVWFLFRKNKIKPVKTFTSNLGNL